MPGPRSFLAWACPRGGVGEGYVQRAGYTRGIGIYQRGGDTRWGGCTRGQGVGCICILIPPPDMGTRIHHPTHPTGMLSFELCFQ